MKELEDFKQLFWDAFHQPKLKTGKFEEVWRSLEPVNDKVAGPFYSIYSNGNCNYVFEDKDRFPGINDADDFMDYCTSVIQSYYESTSAITADNEDEKHDKQLLLYQVDMKMELAHLAYQIVKSKNLNLPDKE